MQLNEASIQLNNHISYKDNYKNTNIYELSLEQKNLKLQIVTMNNIHKRRLLQKKRNKISHNIRKLSLSKYNENSEQKLINCRKHTQL